ncbi:MAG: hybrid sensor histidine kinase/response regulator [Aminivibrio sp.]|jgi:two-component system chemotaxis sensor kinase CheA
MMDLSEKEFLEELRKDFVPEAEEYIQTIVSGLLDMEEGAVPAEGIEEVYRAAHSLKGAAQAVQMPRIGEVCQAMESIFSGIKDGFLRPSVQEFDVLQRAADLIADMVASGGDDRGQAGEMRRKLEAVLAAPPGTAPSPDVYEEPVEEDSSEPLPPVEDEEPRPGAVQPKGSGRETVRVAASRLDGLLLEAEELISVNQAFAARRREAGALRTMLSAGLGEWRKARESLKRTVAGNPCLAGVEEFFQKGAEGLRRARDLASALEKKLAEDGESSGVLTQNLLEEARSTVMLPFSALLQGFPKIVRDLSRSLGREVDFKVEGGEAEVDKRILEGLKDPLIHLVRNAADHGIESPADREAAGKPSRGTITLSVSPVEGGRVEVTLADDGRGIDPRALRERAVKSGMISAAEARLLSDEAALMLIFQSGLSTSSIITEVSGRGLGMAIVREGVENMGGRISLASVPGERTAFTISLPVTLATFRGVIVEEWGRLFVLPTANVKRVARVRRCDVKRTGNRETVLVDGKPCGLARLGAVLELDPPADFTERDVFSIAAAGTGDAALAFIVDRVADEQEVLLKPMGDRLKRVRNVAGVTVLGTGEAIPVLHCGDLVKSALKGSFRERRPSDEAAKEPLKILVAEDSITSRTLLKHILTAAGYRVLTASDGMEALEIFSAEGADLVVSDIEMPRMNGFELVSGIRATEGMSETPVILVTSLESEEDRERGAAAGADAYIVKSGFDQGALLDVIKRLT